MHKNLCATFCDFYPRPPRGGRQGNTAALSVTTIFLSTPSARRATDKLSRVVRTHQNFYPRPPRGGRRDPSIQYAYNLRFLSTPSARRATQDITAAPQTLAISIHALREEGDAIWTSIIFLRQIISIHALREEGDRFKRRQDVKLTIFLSTPSARRATAYFYGIISNIRFLSTPSARRATSGTRRPSLRISNFYPRPPRGGRPEATEATEAKQYFYPRPPRGGRPIWTSIIFLRQIISIHALREEGDRGVCREGLQPGHISIHALREEGDRPRSQDPRRSDHFYPRPPRGGRQYTRATWPNANIFLSTPSARRATHQCEESRYLDKISIHALREEGDAADEAGHSFASDFYPRPPRGGRRTLQSLP